MTHHPRSWLFAQFPAAMAVALLALTAWPASSQEAPSPLDKSLGVPDEEQGVVWYDVRELGVEGKGWEETESYYHRLPAKAKGVVRGPVWNLGTDSAGLCVRFVSDSDRIASNWTLASKSLAMPHFAATGVSGQDLYVRNGGRWSWIGSVRPEAQSAKSVLAKGIPEGPHEYLLYLPLYNGVESLSIGIAPEAFLAPAPPRSPERAKPIFFYGTSIMQGGCASRPGMAIPALVGRALEWSTINLGFSGNGEMEPEMAELLSEVDVAAYVLDCLPNMSPELVTERVEPFVRRLRQSWPNTHIVLVENIPYQAGAFLPASREAYESKNAALQAAYDHLLAEGVTGLTYVPCTELLGDDGEATVDGTHPTDLGFLRYADAIAPVLRGVLGLQ